MTTEQLDIQAILAKDPDQMTQEETNLFQIYMIGILTDRVTAQSESLTLHEQCIVQLQDSVKAHEQCIGELQDAIQELRKQLDVMKGVSEQFGKQSEGGILLL